MGERKKPRGAEGEAWGILNPYGDLWGWTTFETEEKARQYVADFWRGTSSGGDLSRFRPIRVRVHVTALPVQEPTP